MAKKLTNIVKGAAVQLDMTNTCAIEKQVAMPICYGSAEGAWNAALVYPNGTTSNYPGKIFDNVGWVRGTKLAHGEWGAYLWVIQNKIAFQSSTSTWWRVSTNGFPVAITNVMVGSLGDYQAMSNVVDVGPHLDATTNYPGANQSDTKEYRVDISNVYYQLSIPDIWITPRFAVTCIGGSNVQYTVTGTNIPQGVTWSLIPDLSGSGGATIPSSNAWQAAVAPGNVATNYKVRATSKDNTNFYTNFYDQVSLTVLKVDITDPAENDVHLKGEEVKFDGEVEPAGLSGLTYAWSVLEGTCDPATATTEDFQTTLMSEGTNKVKLAVAVGGMTFEKIRMIKAVLPEVTKLSWTNDHDLLQGATGSNQITDPVWIKTLGGAVTKNEPGAYTKDGYATATLEIEGDSLLTHSTSVQVKGDGNTENFDAQGATFHNWTWSSGELQLESSPLYASVNFYDTLDVTWYYCVEKLAGGWGDWVEMNQSQHVLYTTLTTPTSPEATPHVVIISNACHWAANQQTADSVCQGMLDNGFKTNYVWDMSCAYLSSDFIRLISSVGIEGAQHRWRSLWDNPHVGAMVEQRTINFTPVGGSETNQEWNWHQWAEAASKQRDASSGSSLPGAWGDYEDYFFSHYRVCTNLAPDQTTWVTNQPGQSMGCEVYPTNCLYLTGTNLPWSGPPGPQFW